METEIHKKKTASKEKAIKKDYNKTIKKDYDSSALKSFLMKLDIRDLGIRFIFGGTAVAACYVLLQHLPSKSFAGVFAAFPAVMAAAVIMAGHFGNSKQAADTALGASAGMLGCAVCVLTATFCMEYLNLWGLSLAIAVAVWFFSSYAAIILMQSVLEKRKVNSREKTLKDRKRVERSL